MKLYVGGDVSKGYADFCVMNGKGEILHEIRLDDTRKGHDRMRELVQQADAHVGEDEELQVALEATGGLELNWLHLFNDMDEDSGADLEVYRLNPLIIRRFTEQQLHSNKTDEFSARVLADYLPLGLAEQHAAFTDAGPSDGLKTLARKTQRMVNQSVELKNELQVLLQRAHPELVQYVRGHMGQWVLRLIQQYPTPDAVVEAGPDTLSAIPYLSEKRAAYCPGRPLVGGQSNRRRYGVYSLACGRGSASDHSAHRSPQGAALGPRERPARGPYSYLH
jgi:hypothetical protein